MFDTENKIHITENKDSHNIKKCKIDKFYVNKQNKKYYFDFKNISKPIKGILKNKGTKYTNIKTPLNHIVKDEIKDKKFSKIELNELCYASFPYEKNFEQEFQTATAHKCYSSWYKNKEGYKADFILSEESIACSDSGTNVHITNRKVAEALNLYIYNLFEPVKIRFGEGNIEILTQYCIMGPIIGKVLIIEGAPTTLISIGLLAKNGISTEFTRNYMNMRDEYTGKSLYRSYVTINNLYNINIERFMSLKIPEYYSLYRQVKDDYLKDEIHKEHFFNINDNLYFNENLNDLNNNNNNISNLNNEFENISSASNISNKRISDQLIKKFYGYIKD